MVKVEHTKTKLVITITSGALVSKFRIGIPTITELRELTAPDIVEHTLVSSYADGAASVDTFIHRQGCSYTFDICDGASFKVSDSAGDALKLLSVIASVHEESLL